MTFRVALAAALASQAAALSYVHEQGADAAPQGADLEFRFGHRAQPKPRFLKCLADGAAAAQNTGLADAFRRCLADSQAQCGTDRTLQVCSHVDAGFGSGMHTWVMSFAYALEHNLAWSPVGPWAYADPEACGAGTEGGLTCYFEKVTNCTESSMQTVCANVYSRAKHQTLIIQAAELLGVPRAWVWGQLMAYILQARPWVAQLVKQRVPERLSEGPFVALHMRVGTNMTGEDDPSWGRNKEGVRPYMAGLEKLGRGSNGTVYVMTDDPSLTEERLQELSPGLSFVRPQRATVDLSKARPNGTSARDVVVDLLADIEAAVSSDVFVGTISNIFWLVYALKQTREGHTGVACWLDTVRKKSLDTLVCPWDQGFYWHGPRGLTSHPTEEMRARIRAGDPPAVAKERAAQIMAWRNGKGPCWSCEAKLEANQDMWSLFRKPR